MKYIDLAVGLIAVFCVQLQADDVIPASSEDIHAFESMIDSHQVIVKPLPSPPPYIIQPNLIQPPQVQPVIQNTQDRIRDRPPPPSANEHPARERKSFPSKPKPPKDGKPPRPPKKDHSGKH